MDFAIKEKVRLKKDCVFTLSLPENIPMLQKKFYAFTEGTIIDINKELITVSVLLDNYIIIFVGIEQITSYLQRWK